jgi:hypothetical protein
MDKRMQRVFNGISEIFSDTSVSPETTLELMEEIASDVEGKCDALREDIKRKEKESYEPGQADD